MTWLPNQDPAHLVTIIPSMLVPGAFVGASPGDDLVVRDLIPEEYLGRGVRPSTISRLIQRCLDTGRVLVIRCDLGAVDPDSDSHGSDEPL